MVASRMRSFLFINTALSLSISSSQVAAGLEYDASSSSRPNRVRRANWLWDNNDLVGTTSVNTSDSSSGDSPGVPSSDQGQNDNPTASPITFGALAPGLMDPSTQSLFENYVPNALGNYIDPYQNQDSYIKIGIWPVVRKTGLRDPSTGKALKTRLFAYGTDPYSASWPGPTIFVQTDQQIEVEWSNQLYNIKDYPFTNLKGESILDKTIHWAYSLPGYQQYSIEDGGIPVVVHVHGLSTRDGYDGNPEYFFNPGNTITGPGYQAKTYIYSNKQPAGALWYHDHVLGTTRLGVNAGLAGFYIVRDDYDTGKEDNPCGLPAGDYEKGYAIQDRMFKENGEMFIPSSEGEPYYVDFITDENVNWDSSKPSIFTEFFGDFMLVNGKIWPKEDVEPAAYRFRLLNGCDSRFIVIEFRACEYGSTDALSGVLVPYTVVGSDQGLLVSPIPSITRSLIEMGARLDIVIDFSGYKGKRIIMTNLGGDVPFDGTTIPGPQVYQFTDRIMAFDVSLSGDSSQPVDLSNLWWERYFPEVMNSASKIRNVGLFEGRDSFNRLQPLLGGEKGKRAIQTYTWMAPTTETPMVGTTEDWVIWNFSPDAHPIHMHQVYFQILARFPIIFDSNVNAEGFLNSTTSPQGDGVYLKTIPLTEHDGSIGEGVRAVFPGDRLDFIDRSAKVTLGQEFAGEIGGRKDMVTVIPGQVAVVRMFFRHPGRFVWHCHLLSHEDHEMMRVFEVESPDSTQAPQHSE